jgi:hypothetical protein
MRPTKALWSSSNSVQSLLAGSSEASSPALGVLAVGFLVNRRSSGSPVDAEARHSSGGRFEWSWTRPTARHEGDLTAIARMLEDDAGLQGELRDSRRFVLKGGSQVWTRLRGGYFIDRHRLPIEVDLAESAASGEVELTVRDRMGPAVGDARMRERYAERASEIRDLVWPADEPHV